MGKLQITISTPAYLNGRLDLDKTSDQLFIHTFESIGGKYVGTTFSGGSREPGEYCQNLITFEFDCDNEPFLNNIMLKRL